MKKVIISGMIGNALEWYDYALYAQFASIISQQFFPKQDETVSLIATFGVFAVGFLVRPIGAVLFGIIGDRYGRRLALSLAILLMSVPTACIGLLPSYEQIGIAAPLLLTLIRILQGLSLGGEFSGCIAYVVEHAPMSRRGLAGSTSFVSMCIGILMGSLTAICLSSILSEQDLKSWGWRMPFIAGLAIGVIGLYIRMHLSESPIYQKAKDNGEISAAPLTEILVGYMRPMLVAMGIYMNVTVPFYLVSIFVNNFMQSMLKYPIADSVFINCMSLITLIIVMPLSAHMSDKVGRKPMLLTGIILNIVLAYPIFLMLNSGGFILPLISQILFATATGIYMGPMPTTLVELFPTRVRFTGVALSYNLIAGLFGGTAPMFSFWLINATKNNLSIAYYVMAAALVSLFTIVFYKETYTKKI
jgi:MHS family proline/betaine transporter-like MFS transporter